jgi:hypothetical protein
LVNVHDTRCHPSADDTEAYDVYTRHPRGLSVLSAVYAWIETVPVATLTKTDAVYSTPGSIGA